VLLRGSGLRRHNCAGATLVEAAIGLPLVLLLVLAIIDFGWVLAQHLVMCDVMEKTVRKVASSAGGGSCTLLAQNELSNLVAAAPLKVDYGGVAIQVQAITINVSSGTLTIPVNGLRLRLTGQHQCLFCSAVPGGFYAYQLSRFIVQQGGTCIAP
jgi:Flp pilus assembly protein TadG